MAKVSTLSWLEGGEAMCFWDWKKHISPASGVNRWGCFKSAQASRGRLTGLWGSGSLVTYGLQALAPSRTLQTLWVQEELSGLVAEALDFQLTAQGPQGSEEAAGNASRTSVGVWVGMTKGVLTAGGDGGFAKRTFSGDWVSE